jgi:membrane protein implicated in regulation of membrane protease activity
MIGIKRTLASVLVALLLVGTAGVSVWLLASAGVFTGGSALPGAPTTPGTVASAAADPLDPSTDFQVAQPRDPFEPLIVPPSTTAPPDGSTTSTTAGDGSTTSTTAGGSTTTTTAGDQPSGTRITLLEVRTETTGRVAVVEVDGQTYTVSVGDTFADNFKVVSLSDNGGVFTYGDSAFTLAVGQSILK